MSANVETTSTHQSIAFLATGNAPIAPTTTTLTLIKQQTTPIECCLNLNLNSELYQHIVAESLFNLKPATLNTSSRPDFQTTPTIQLEISLKPDLLQQLQEHATTAEATANYLFTLNEIEPTHSLFHTESWLALAAKQLQATGEVGYQTLWAYLRPSKLAQVAESDNGAAIADAISTFFKDWTESQLAAVTQTTTVKALDGFAQFFAKLTDTAVDGFVEAVTAEQSLFEAVCDFFKQEQWPFIKLPEQTALQLLAQAKNGQWTCYATVRETEKIFAFYSVCPIPAANARRANVAEFIARANQSLLIGNFELDYSDGEIRYKTSIDVEGVHEVYAKHSRLTPALIRNLVYTNVLTMDQYLPGLLAVIDQDVTPEEAVHLIEQDKTA